MPLVTTLVTGYIYDADGSPLANTPVTLRLTKAEIDNGIVVPEILTPSTDANGLLSVQLWPNQRGQAGSQYRITVKSFGGAGERKLFDRLMTVPDTGVAQLQDIIDTEPPDTTSVSAALRAAEQAAVSASQAFDAQLGANEFARQASLSAEGALASEQAAAQSALNAGQSTDQAVASAAAALVSEQNALSSANTASAAATTAVNNATNAGVSAGQSAASAAAALASQQSATMSASNAATSATNSANSATASATSATNSANSATASANSATASANSATASATSAAQALLSKNAASLSETNAANSAASALASKIAAAVSETNAAASAVSADTSADEAFNSAQVALAATGLAGIVMSRLEAISVAYSNPGGLILVVTDELYNGRTTYYQSTYDGVSPTTTFDFVGTGTGRDSPSMTFDFVGTGTGRSSPSLEMSFTADSYSLFDPADSPPSFSLFDLDPLDESFSLHSDPLMVLSGDPLGYETYLTTPFVTTSATFVTVLSLTADILSSRKLRLVASARAEKATAGFLEMAVFFDGIQVPGTEQQVEFGDGSDNVSLVAQLPVLPGARTVSIRVRSSDGTDATVYNASATLQETF